MVKDIDRRVEGAYLTEAKQNFDDRVEDLRRLLEAILIRGRKCNLKIHFDGKQFRWDYTAPNVRAEDLIQS